ncbi:SDR family oxidoreductase [Bacillus velezensis]|uniref:SDR family oxidoreductase n=1 Tax=Bacillus velezensis TaxID=492670 RepID=UPI0029D563A3|nr:SDR family oxidoreductase [Bacillus velezensis]MDX7893648.1 SDR family oxidoreductase [Bacillus velezensis]MDX8025530.1 SDR family oxidoreductase [Bacillus velezensis]MDX8197879.1 SDR family oxidoreductase [Bacillus velezensis]MDX8224521.1 SDR family oxidoreductase [Bacillus velezensis]
MRPIHGRLSGRTAVITGGSGVLCSAMAKELSRQGMKIAIVSRNADKAERAAGEIADAGGTAVSVPADVSARDSLEKAKDEIIRLLLQEDGSLTDRSNKIMAHTPMKRFGKPEDLLGTLLWLSDDSYSGFITGVTVPVDGGFMAYSGV